MDKNSDNLAPNDAALIPQPTYEDLWNAYVTGAKSGQSHPDATQYEISRSADAYCKLFHLEKGPESFAALGKPATNLDHLVKKFREMFPDADSVRISTPPGRMFLVLGCLKHTKDQPGQWVDQDGEEHDWSYLEEATVAGGRTECELAASAEYYKRVSTFRDYINHIYTKK